MIRHGYSYTTSIEKKDRVYCSDRFKIVTQVLGEIWKDSRRGGNSALNYI